MINVSELCFTVKTIKILVTTDRQRRILVNCYSGRMPSLFKIASMVGS